MAMRYADAKSILQYQANCEVVSLQRFEAETFQTIIFMNNLELLYNQL